MGRFLPPDHSKGDPDTIGGYMAVHDRPAAFEGSDGASYSVEIVTEASGERDRPFAAYLLFVRWRHGDPVASGHLETEFLALAPTEEEARTMVGAMMLKEVKLRLDALIQARRTETLPWWDAMRQEGSN
ncbi:MAG TPA: hypothetical protein VK494_05320 [Gemmatimonadaceae bacterium]|jgi:hypothetical protein|nr:hypothetical protein [Gemmatimonadaceae bacterium]